MDKKRVLRATLKKEWFDKISNGSKRYEYREYKKFWAQRLLNKSKETGRYGGHRDYDEILFTNGYGKRASFIRVEFLGLAIIKGDLCDPENGEHLDPEKKYFVILLGKILERGVRGELI